MNDDEGAQQLSALNSDREDYLDREAEHGDAHKVITRLLKEGGYPKTAEAWEEASDSWWYA